jgi:hypothetical protein
MKETTEKKELMRVVAVNKKYERAPIARAPRYKNGKPLWGFENDKTISEEEKKLMKEVFPLNDEDVVVIKHLDQFDMSDPQQKAKYIFFVNTQEDLVAKSKATVKPSKHRFYIENKVEDALINVDKFSKKRKAMETAYAVMDGGEEKIKDSLRLLGIPFKGYSLIQLQEALLMKAETDSTFFIRTLDDRSANERIFIAKLLEHGIIKKTKTKTFIYNESVIAINEIQMIEYISEKKNADLVDMWAKTMKVGKEANSDDEVNNVFTCYLKIPSAIKLIQGLKTNVEIDNAVIGEEREQVLSFVKQRREQLE